MTTTTEIRVRAVTRFVVTLYTTETDGTVDERGRVETIGEFANDVFANRVAQALHTSDPDSKLLLAECPERNGVFYANTHAQAQALLDFIHSPEFPKE